MATTEEIQNLIINDITAAYKEVIDRNGLVKTGELRDSVVVEFENEFNLNIKTQFYYKFLDEGTRRGIRPYELTRQLEEHPLFRRALLYYEELLAIKIINSLNKK